MKRPVCSGLVLFSALILLLLPLTRSPALLPTPPHGSPGPALQVVWAGRGSPFSRPWPAPAPSHCRNFTTRFAANGSLPARALASYPGSGNTWLR